MDSEKYGFQGTCPFPKEVSKKAFPAEIPRMAVPNRKNTGTGSGKGWLSKTGFHGWLSKKGSLFDRTDGSYPQEGILMILAPDVPQGSAPDGYSGTEEGI